MSDLFLRACRGEPLERIPVWMMRQAGRYLPAYRRVRERADFLTMVHTPELAAEVTLQPVDLLGVDAAIIFSDILVVPQAMGMALTVEEGVGPVFPAPLRGPEDIALLRPVVPEESLAGTLAALRIVRTELDGKVPVIGFAGAPWTLAAYMLEGSGSRTFHRSRRLIALAPDVAHDLLARVEAGVGAFLDAQIAAGAQAIQLFDSWAGALSATDFRTFALPGLTRLTQRAQALGVPVIVFAPGAAWAIEEMIESTGADVIGVDWTISASEADARTHSYPVVRQGNFDPVWLHDTPTGIAARAEAMCAAFGGVRHIANLGHGITPDVPPAHARAFIEAVQQWQPR